jgi:hypothetical protein
MGNSKKTAPMAIGTAKTWIEKKQTLEKPSLLTQTLQKYEFIY